MKLIALDVGTVRIGVAKADSAVRIAVPYAAVEVDGNEFQKIASLARAWDINSFVIGLPRNSAGEETAQSKYVREFAKQLKSVIPEAKICFQDESLTSVEAEKRLKSRKKGYKKGDVDSEAATIILQDFLEAKMGKSVTKAAAAKRKSVKGAKPHRLFTAFVAIIVLLGALAGGGYFYYDYSLRAVQEGCNGACGAVAFEVQSGATLGEVADDLAHANLVRNSLVFQIFYRLRYGDRGVQAGEYNLSQRMSVREIAELLVVGDNVFSFTVLPGENIFQVQARLAEVGYTADEIEAGFAADFSNEEFAWVFDGKPAEAGLEGYLYGETYEFYTGEEVYHILATMISETARVVRSNGLVEAYAAQGLNLYQGLTLASIVQKEANGDVDQAKVAQVFYNRLNAGDKLGSDVTVQYAADLIDPERVTYTDNTAVLGIDSPYNTRVYAGLPYGPIANPGIGALLAVANPDGALAGFWYFLTGDDGAMYYSSSYEEHRQNISEHCQVLCSVSL